MAHCDVASSSSQSQLVAAAAAAREWWGNVCIKRSLEHEELILLPRLE